MLAESAKLPRISKNAFSEPPDIALSHCKGPIHRFCFLLDWCLGWCEFFWIFILAKQKLYLLWSKSASYLRIQNRIGQFYYTYVRTMVGPTCWQLSLKLKYKMYLNFFMQTAKAFYTAKPSIALIYWNLSTKMNNLKLMM